MISKNDTLVLLANLKANGVDTTAMTKKVLTEGVSVEVLTFINDNRSLDIANFYEKIRKTYNAHKSKLYKNIISEKTFDDPNEVVLTLTSYCQQVQLFLKTIDDKQMFIRFARLPEVYKALYYWSTTYDPEPCIKLLSYLRNDIKVLETCYR